MTEEQKQQLRHPERADNPFYQAVIRKVEVLLPPDDPQSVCACDHSRLLHHDGKECVGVGFGLDGQPGKCYCECFRWAPWKGEPDREELRVHGLPCLLVRNLDIGNWCGYVGVPPGHPWHGRDYSGIRPNPDGHGGLTYASECAGMICHTPEPGESDDVWWLGFDCCHSSDSMPYSDEIIRPAMKSWHDAHPDFDRDSFQDYKRIEYVRGEVVRLADQAKIAGDRGYNETCHILFNGLPMCRFRVDQPGHWPPGHVWVAKDDRWDCNCEGCRAALEAEAEKCSTE